MQHHLNIIHLKLQKQTHKIHGESKKTHKQQMSSFKSRFNSKCSIDSKKNCKENNNDKPSWKSRIIHFLFHDDDDDDDIDDLTESQLNIINPSKAAILSKQSPTLKTDSVNSNIHLNKISTKTNRIDSDSDITTDAHAAKSKSFILNIAELRNCEIVSPFDKLSDSAIAENETPIWKLWGQYQLQDTSSLSLYSYLVEDNSDLKGEPNFVLVNNEYSYYSTCGSSDDEESEQRTFDGEFEIL